MAVTTNHYNLIVLGSDVAGLVAAAHAAHRGQRVLVIPTRPIAGTYRLGADVFPLDTAPVVQLASPAIRRSCDELGLWPQVRREVRPAAPWVHWITERHRLDLQVGARNLEQEASREWPGDDVVAAWQNAAERTIDVDALYDDILGAEGSLSTERFWIRRFLDRTGAKLPAVSFNEFGPLAPEHALGSIATAVCSWLQHLAYDSLGRGAKMRLWGQWVRGPFDRTGGVPGVRELLLARIKLKSGDVKPGMRVAEVLLRRGKAVGIQLLGKTDRYGCDHLIIAEDPRSLVGGPLVPEQLPRPMARSLSAIAVTASRFVLHLRLGPRGLGPGIDGIAICPPSQPIEAEKGSAELGTTQIRLGPRREDGGRDMSLCSLVAPDAPLHELADRLLDELDERGVLPWARRHVQLMHSPHDGLPARDGEGRTLDDLGADTGMKLPMASLYRCPEPPTLGVGVLPPASGIRNLHFASHLSLPGLGLEGDFAAGLAAANIVAPPSRPSFGRSLFLGRGQ